MYKLKVFISSLLAIFIMAIFFTSCQKEEFLEDEKVATIYTELDNRITKYKIVEINNTVLWNDLENQAETAVKLTMQNATKDAEIAKLSFTLERKQVQAEDFKFYLIGEEEKLTEINMPTPHVLDGQISDEKGDAFMIVNNENFRAEFSMEDGVHRLEPLSDHIINAPVNEYIEYNVNDVIVNDKLTCGTDINTQDIINDKQATGRSANDCIQIEISYLGDYELYQRFGYNYNNASNWMYWRVIYAGRLYHRSNNYNIDFIVKKGYLYSRDVYVARSGNTNTFLQQWQNFASRSSSWYRKGDANILFTGRNVGGSNHLGTAWLRSICTANPFCFVKYTQSTRLADAATAHELGHILGANHSSGGLMNAFIDSRYIRLNNSARNEIKNFLLQNNRCLSVGRCQ